MDPLAVNRLVARASWLIGTLVAAGACTHPSAAGGGPTTTAAAPPAAPPPAAPPPVEPPPVEPPPVEAPPTTPPPVVTGPALDWMWIAGDVPAWRAAGAVRDVIALDDRRALGLVGTDKLAVIDLAAGVVTVQPIDLGKGGRATRLVQAGARVIAYGLLGKASAAWTIDPTRLVAAPAPLAEPAAGDAAAGWAGIVASPDGARVITCGADRWPTLRDAATMAAIKVFTGVAACKNPRFVDAGHAQIDRVGGNGTRLLDLSAGTASDEAAGAATVIAGPGGRSVALLVNTATVRGADGKDLATYKGALFNPVWLGDGSGVVAATGEGLRVAPAIAGQALRTIPLPARAARIVPIPGTTRLVVQFGAHRLGVVDATTGALRTAADVHLGPVAKLAALDGAVVSGGERLRVWRAGRLVATSDRRMTVEALDVDRDAPALVATFDGVFAVDLATGAATALDDEAASATVDRQGDRMAWDRDDRVMWQAGDRPPTAWLRRASDYYVLDVDVATGRVALNDEAAFYVVRPDRRQLFGFHPFDCEDPTYLTLERGRERAVSYDGVTVHLYDTAKRKGLGGLELVDDNIEASAFIPGSAALALVGESIYLWDPIKHTVAAWPLPAERAAFDATSIGLDPAGTQVAVGFSDGAVLWIALDALRARARAVGADVATQHPPAAVRCDKPMIKRVEDLRGADPDADDEAEDREGEGEGAGERGE